MGEERQARGACEWGSTWGERGREDYTRMQQKEGDLGGRGRGTAGGGGAGVAASSNGGGWGGGKSALLCPSGLSPVWHHPFVCGGWGWWCVCECVFGVEVIVTFCLLQGRSRVGVLLTSPSRQGKDFLESSGGGKKKGNYERLDVWRRRSWLWLTSWVREEGEGRRRREGGGESR